jgi:hypothetical protein
MYRRALCAATLAVFGPYAISRAVADTSEPEPRPEAAGEPRAAPAPDRELTAADVADAPRPGSESGRTDVEPGDSATRLMARALLFVPRVLIGVLFVPVRAVALLHARYDLVGLYERTFFTADRTLGVYPTLGFESGFGINAGATFVDRDVFGEHEHLAVQASIGGQYRQLYALGLRSGDRFGRRFQVELDIGYERRPNDLFYGIGNGDVVAAPAMPIDPLTDPTAVEVRFRQQRLRALVIGDVRAFDDVHVRPSAAIGHVTFGDSPNGPPIDMVYDPAGLVGFGGMSYAYEELELRWDDRRRITRWEPRALFTTGWLVGAFGGHFDRLDGGPSFWRYGFDAQHFIRIAAGPRVLITRVHGEAVSGSRDEVPFTELPKLGGLSYLRGYQFDRFRDRVAAFGSVEYQWDLARRLSASLFVDVGRVFPSIDELSVHHLRVGYGVALEIHTENAFVLEGSIASSIDGGVLLNLAFNPVLDIEERVRRR